MCLSWHREQWYPMTGCCPVQHKSCHCISGRYSHCTIQFCPVGKLRRKHGQRHGRVFATRTRFPSRRSAGPRSGPMDPCHSGKIQDSEPSSWMVLSTSAAWPSNSSCWTTARTGVWTGADEAGRMLPVAAGLVLKHKPRVFC